jgi:glycosidase
MKHNSIIYQIFPRNHSKEGTFKKIEEDLTRISSLGIDVIYLMPIHEIGVKERKGTYGSPYAIKDYFSISPDLGTLEDFKSLVNEIHKLGMKIILDMVFNHTAPDSILLEEHEDYYYHKDGKIINKVSKWTDIIDLETSKKETQDYLIKVLKYWVSNGVDGFRFDVASVIPINFFIRARKELGDDIIFIGECVGSKDKFRKRGFIVNEDNEMYPTFNSLYNYNYYFKLMDYIKGQGKIDEIIEELNRDKNNLRLICLENHDNERIAALLNKERLSHFLDFISFIKGQIFIYAGQEYGNKHKPELFEKDPIDFSYCDNDIYQMYLDLIKKKKNQKKINDMNFSKINENSILVQISYEDGNKEQKEFEL